MAALLTKAQRIYILWYLSNIPCSAVINFNVKTSRTYSSVYLTPPIACFFYGLDQLKSAFDNYFILSSYVCDGGEIHRACELKKTKSLRIMQEMYKKCRANKSWSEFDTFKELNPCMTARVRAPLVANLTPNLPKSIVWPKNKTNKTETANRGN